MRNNDSRSPLIKSITLSDLSICDCADSFLQSSMWGRFKSRFGWDAKAFSVDWVYGGIKPLLVLCRCIAPGFSMAYIPWGPELPADFPDDSSLRTNAVTELGLTLRQLLPRSVTFIRFDFAFSSSLNPHSSLLVKAAADIQAPDTVIVDLSPSPEAILAAMKPKCRYNIKLAEKHKVIVRCHTDSGSQSAIPVFYQLLSETSARDGIAIHHIAYYRALFEECLNDETTHAAAVPARLRLYTAEHEGDTLAAIVALFRGEQAVYLYGASANVKRNLMSPYALQWQAMRDAKENGCTRYDLFGIPPDENPDHPMAGLYRFKTGFGGCILHRGGSWDYPCKPLLYVLFSTAESLRKKIRDKRKK